MKIPDSIMARVPDDFRMIYDQVVAICARYPVSRQNSWSAGVLIFALETYVRIAKSVEMNLERGNEEMVAGIVDAHFADPVLSDSLLELAARSMQKLQVPDAIRIVAYAEEIAARPFPGQSPGYFSASLPVLQELVDLLAARMSPAAGSSRFQFDVARAPRVAGSTPCRTNLGASRLSRRPAGYPSGARQTRQGGLVFVTLRTDAEFLTAEPVSRPEGTVFLKGNPKGGLFSPYGIGRGSWRLNIHFSIFNSFPSTVVVYDLHAQVYNRLNDTGVLATVAHTMAVELAQDNSILGTHAPVNLDAGDSLTVSLAMEASVFENPKTTVVFGLAVDYYTVADGSAVRRFLASDALYVFQHSSDMGSKCHFVSRTREAIEERMRNEQGNPEVQSLCRTLVSIMQQHNPARSAS
jgi:hypothetical protein